MTYAFRNTVGAAAMVLATAQTALAQDPAAQAADLEALARALRQQAAPATPPARAAQPPAVRTAPGAPAAVPAARGNLHLDGVQIPDTPQLLLAYLESFDPRQTRVETVLIDLCTSLTRGTRATAEVQAICSRHLTPEQ